MNKPTDIQIQIEDAVTNGRGYDRKNTERIPGRLMNTEIGVQIALANMDTDDGKIDLFNVIDIGPRIDALLKKFDRAGIPLEVITDAEGFRHAFNSAYEPILNDDRAVAYRQVAQLTAVGEFDYFGGK